MADIAFLTERMRLGFGVDLVVDKLATGLAAAGHRVTVYTPYEDGTYRGGPYRIVGLPVPASANAVRYDWQAGLVVRGSGLVDEPVDVWVAATPPFYSVLPLLPGHRVAMDHGVSDWKGQPASRRRNARITQLLQQRAYFHAASRVVTVSRWLLDQLPRAIRPRAVAIHNGADHYPVADDAAGRAFRAGLGVADDEVLSLYLGRLNPHHQPYKGTARLLAMHRRVAAAAPACRLLMAGFGTDDDVSWVRAEGAMALANVPVEEVPAVLAAADLYVTASRWEGFDLPLVEAQHAGRPVVAFRRGAHAEVVDDGRGGALVDDEDQFVAAMARYVGHPELRARAGQHAARFVQQFSWQAAVERWDDLVTGLVGARAPTAGRTG